MDARRPAARAAGCSRRTDGGDHWTEITRNPGLPAGICGNIGITVSRRELEPRLGASSRPIRAACTAPTTRGATWTRTNTDRKLRQRAWYYTKIHADPKDTNVVYVQQRRRSMKSTDGGKTFRPVRGLPHGDKHDLWIAAERTRSA